MATIRFPLKKKKNKWEKDESNDYWALVDNLGWHQQGV